MDVRRFSGAIIEEMRPIDVLHDNVGVPRFGRTCIDDPCDIRVLHVGEHLLFSLKPLDHLLGFCIPLNQF